MCYEILGFDVILDSKLKPWLLEVNFTPSFNTDSSVDMEIKSGVIEETMKLINVTENNRKLYEIKKTIMLKRRTFKRKIKNFDIIEKAKIIKETQIQKNNYENKVLKNFERIYPVSEKDKLVYREDFEEFINYASNKYRTWTGTQNVLTVNNFMNDGCFNLINKIKNDSKKRPSTT